MLQQYFQPTHRNNNDKLDLLCNSHSKSISSSRKLIKLLVQSWIAKLHSFKASKIEKIYKND